MHESASELMEPVVTILVRELEDINKLIAGTRDEIAEASSKSERWLRQREHQREYNLDDTLATTNIAFYAQREKSIRKNLKHQMKIKRALLDKLTGPGAQTGRTSRS